MEFIKKKKKKIIIGLIGIILFLSLILTIYYFIDQEKKRTISFGEKKYEKAHELYFSGRDIEYVYNSENERTYIEIDENKYYEIKNYNKLYKDLFAKEQLEKVKEIFSIVEQDGKVYIADFGRGISNYYGTTLKIKDKAKQKIEYEAISTLCKKDSITRFGEGCTPDGYYTISKPFTIVKEDGKWKVLEYTSIFQFSDREFK